MSRARECWAKSLGDCAGKISEEHTISESVLAQFADEKTKIKLQGLPFCLTQAISIPIARVVANNLCEGHNRALSPVDAAGAQLFRDLDALRKGHAGLSGARVLAASPEVRTIDGPLVARWLLKTLVNTAWHGPLPIGAPGGPPGTPTFEVVEIAFGRRSCSAAAPSACSGRRAARRAWRRRARGTAASSRRASGTSGATEASTCARA